MEIIREFIDVEDALEFLWEEFIRLPDYEESEAGIRHINGKFQVWVYSEGDIE